MRVEGYWSKLCEELLAAEERGIHARLREIEDFVLSRLKDLSGLLAGEIPRATAALTKHSRDIPLTPEGKTYRRRMGFAGRTFGWRRGPEL